MPNEIKELKKRLSQIKARLAAENKLDAAVHYDSDVTLLLSCVEHLSVALRIPVRAGKPTLEKRVLIWVGDDVRFGRYGNHNGRKRWFDEDGRLTKVTHWFPIPETAAAERSIGE